MFPAANFGKFGLASPGKRAVEMRPWDPRRTISIDKPHSRSLTLIPRTSGRGLAGQVFE